jgi:hypothetical protein
MVEFFYFTCILALAMRRPNEGIPRSNGRVAPRKMSFVRPITFNACHAASEAKDVNGGDAPIKTGRYPT